AVDAATAGPIERMMRVRLAIDPALVTAHAERVTLEPKLSRVRLVAMDAAHAERVHAARKKRCVLVILLAHLAVGIERVRVIGDVRAEVIEEEDARDEIAGEIRASRVARSAGVDDAIGIDPWREVRRR